MLELRAYLPVHLPIVRPSFSRGLLVLQSNLPYANSVTSVGATQNVNPETSAPFSSGGFSNYFSTPKYQATAKARYLSKLGKHDTGRFNTHGRGFPDVAAAGTNLEIVLEGSLFLAEGTSCSTPVFASVISLLNDRLIGAGRPVLGFLNPFLYSHGAKALHDITSGSNPGCGTNGFPAKAGWDPVSSLPFYGRWCTHVFDFR